MYRVLGIFCIYDKNGIVGRYVEYLLGDILENIDDLIIVVNGSLQPKEAEKLEKYTSDIRYRENVGYDAGAYQFVLKDLFVNEKIHEYDQLVLFNDSFYGPLYSFRRVFEEMANENEDFWGLTKYAASDRKNSVLPRIQEHVQSYFIVINRKMLQSSDFSDFWYSLCLTDTTLVDVVIRFEVGFTRYFAERGYVWGAYVKDDLLNSSEEYNYIHYLGSPYTLVKKYRMPVVKRKVFTEGKDLGISGGEEIPLLMEYIKHYTDYDDDLIWDDILRIYNITDIKNNLNLNFVLNDTSNYSIDNHRVAIIAHLFYEDLVEESFDKLKSIPNGIDVYITSSKQRILDLAKDKITDRCIQCILVENRGRDVAALFVGCKHIVSKYDIICFIHDKKTAPNKGEYTVGASFNYNVWENMLRSDGYIRNIVHLFDTQPRLGMLVPPIPVHDGYIWCINYAWNTIDNYQGVLELSDKMHIKAPIDERKNPYALSTCFWFRNDSLKRVFEYPLTYEDFPEEPYPNEGTLGHFIERLVLYSAQYAGYYVGMVESNEYAQIELQDLRLRVGDLLLSEELTENRLITLWNYVGSHSEIYVYGAGVESKKYCSILEKVGISIKGIIVSDEHMTSEKIKDGIIPLSDAIIQDGIGIVVALNRRNSREVKELLTSKGITDALFISDITDKPPFVLNR